MTQKWEDLLWEELTRKSDLDQFTTAGEWITFITHDLLAELGRARRLALMRLLSRPGWDPTRVAETIGARRSTITSLAAEGRRQLLEEDLDE